MSQQPALQPRVLIVAPMQVELEPIVQRLELQPQGRGFVGVVGGLQVTAVTTGVGAERALTVLRELLAPVPPARLLLAGFAGALEPSLKLGDVPKLDWVIDGQGQGVRLTGGVPQLGREADRTPGQTALLSLGHIVDSPQAKRRLRVQHGAIAVDMESFAVARLAAERGLPLHVLRAISDSADEALPPESVGWVRADGSTNTPAATTWLFQHPWRLGLLLKLRRGAQVAGESLAEVVAGRLQGPAAPPPVG